MGEALPAISRPCAWRRPAPWSRPPWFHV